MSSYDLRTAKSPPPPLRLHETAFKTGSSNDHQLLYDLPSASSISSPPDVNTPSSGVTPTSPTSRTRGNIGASRASRRTPPPAASIHARSTTPQPFREDEFQQFAANCRAWYYKQDDEAGRLMTHTLAKLLPSQRAQFARLQASIRAAYHANMTARRRAEFQAHLSATQPGGSLMPHSRADPNGPMARRERFERLERFLRSWCNLGMPGTKPFFEGLWAVLRLMVVPESLGGAGSKRIEWRIDDAVFMESAGKDFMLEAIDVLKGVLGFEEKRPPLPSSSSQYSDEQSPSLNHARARSEPLSHGVSSGPRDSSIGPRPKRSRAPSDPFVDSPAGSIRALIDTDIGEEGSFSDLQNDFSIYPEHQFKGQADEDHLRIWTSPDLPNPELISLLSVFPTFVTRRTLPRFPVSPARRKPVDLERGILEESDDAKAEVRVGTGSMWLGTIERGDGWKGGWWQRFIQWWRRLLC